uniref:Uncharacterized protein n=1 Tax=Callorhinchus milii TaxID=7868 RepID=A0A4W3HT77_CALMI
MPDHLDTSVSCIVVRIWGGKMGQYCLLIEWKIRAHNPNEIIFGLNDGYYGTPFDHKVQYNTKLHLCSTFYVGRTSQVAGIWIQTGDLGGWRSGRVRGWPKA